MKGPQAQQRADQMEDRQKLVEALAHTDDAVPSLSVDGPPTALALADRQISAYVVTPNALATVVGQWGCTSEHC